MICTRLAFKRCWLNLGFESLGVSLSRQGIDCNKEGNVVGLSLEANNLAGSLPAEISLLNSLSHLTLDSNQIEGTLPSELGLLTALGE